MTSGSDPHPYGRWNYTIRGANTCYDDHFTGRPNKAYVLRNARANQGYHSIIHTFPQASFSSCRYPFGFRATRPESLNNWHTRTSEFDAPAGALQPAYPAQPYNPYSGRPEPDRAQTAPLGPSAAQQAKAALDLAALQALAQEKSDREAEKERLRRGNVVVDRLPTVKDTERNYLTVLRPHEVYRPSRPAGPSVAGMTWDVRRRGWVDTAAQARQGVYQPPMAQAF